MNHPTREEWMSYLYDEQSAAEKTQRAAHLQNCPDCAANLRDWQAAGNQLDAWRLPSRRTRASSSIFPVLKWAAAALVVLGIGFGAGRFASVRAAEARMRGELREEFTRLLHEEIDKAASATLVASSEQAQSQLVDYARSAESRRAEENATVYAALQKLESRRAADYVSLKKDLDTVAVNTDAGLRHTEQQLIQLADVTQSTGSSDPLKK